MSIFTNNKERLKSEKLTELLDSSISTGAAKLLSLNNRFKFQAFCFSGFDANQGTTFIVDHLFSKLFYHPLKPSVFVVRAVNYKPDPRNDTMWSKFASENSSSHSYIDLATIDMHSIRMKLQELKRCYNIILFDAPPLSMPGQLIHLASMCDVVIPVISSGQIHASSALSRLNFLKDYNIRVEGIMLNKCNFVIPDILY